jgi:hypothetical protein
MSELQIPPAVSRLFDHTGPFATVYLDATRSTESGGHELELRWRDLRGQLADHGCDDKTLTALDEAVSGPPAMPGAHGQVLVAAQGAVVFESSLPTPPDRQRAVVAPLPYVLPFLAQSRPRIAHLVVVADHRGADLLPVSADAAATGVPVVTLSVEGSSQYPLHRTGRDEWDERHFQNRVENSWAENAKDVADEAARQVLALGAQLVIVAGDPRARALLKRDLPDVLGPGVQVEEIEAGGRADGASAAALDEAVGDAVLRRSWERRREVLEHLQQNVGRERFGAVGVPAVVEALRKAQVDLAVLSHDPSSTLKVWIGPEPLQIGIDRQDLEAMGVGSPEQDRFDSALVRALAGSSAGLLITPNAHQYVQDGIGALLRYDDESTPKS